MKLKRKFQSGNWHIVLKSTHLPSISLWKIPCSYPGSSIAGWVLFPKGSMITGFRRGKNLGEIICPTNPVRDPPPAPPLPQRKCGCQIPPGRGCRPCSHNICQIHRNLAVTETEHVISYYDNRPILVKKDLDWCTPNLIYLLQCTEHKMQYCGSAVVQ